MGRLQPGESLISKLIENEDPIYPPLALEISRCSDTKKRSAPTVTQSPAKKTKDGVVLAGSESESHSNEESESRGTQEDGDEESQKNESDNSVENEDEDGKSESRESGENDDEESENESCSGGENDNDDDENVRVDEAESGLLSRLGRFYPSKSSEKMKSCDASAAKFVERALIWDLITPQDDFDLESMIDKANGAFAKLSDLGYDFGELYDSVREFLSHHCQLSEATKELESKGSIKEMIVRHNNLMARSNDGVEALISTKISLLKAKDNTASLVIWIEETRALLRELEEKLERGVVEVGTLERKREELEKNFETIKSEQQNIAKEMEENQNVAQEIGARCDKARAGIKMTKARLSSLSYGLES